MMTEEKYNLIKMYERSLKENWDEPAVTDYGTDVTLTYGQIAINIEKLHILFKECGIKKNDKIAVMGRNNSNWVTVFLATITYGAIIVPILQDFRANDAIHIINHSGSKLLFISDINWEGIDLDQIPHVLASVSLNDWHPISLALDPKKINYDAIAEKCQGRAFRRARQRSDRLDQLYLGHDGFQQRRHHAAERSGRKRALWH